MRRALAACRVYSSVALVAAALALSSCGKKNAPAPPPGVPNTYPLPYPRE